MTNLAYFLYLTMLLLATVTGIKRLKFADKAGKILIAYTTLSFICEGVASFSAYRYHNNILVYTVFSVLEFCLMLAYFRHCIFQLQKWKWAPWLPLVLFGLLRWQVGASPGVLSAFQLTEALLTPFLALLYLRQQLLQNSESSLTSDVHFWFCCLLLVYRCAGLFYWVYSSTPGAQCKEWPGILMIVVNLCAVASITVLYYHYPKFINKQSCSFKIMR